MIIYRCDGSVEGIFTAVFEAWKTEPDTAEIETGEENNLVLFAEYVDITTDYNKAKRITNFIRNNISEQAFEMVYSACHSCRNDRGTSVLRFIRNGYKIGSDIVSDLHNPYVMNVFEMSRSVGREGHYWIEFMRFRQQDNFLLAKYESDNDVLMRVAEHFSDRLMQEDFIIVDMKRDRAAVHRKEMKSQYVISSVDIERVKALEYRTEEEEIRLLWETFKDAIAIEARKNLNLQRQMMPLHFRKYMDIRK